MQHSIKAKSGKILEEIKCPGIEHLINFDDTNCLEWLISGKVCLVNCITMKIVKKYSSKIVNPHNCLSILIQNAAIVNNQIMDIFDIYTVIYSDYHIPFLYFA